MIITELLGTLIAALIVTFIAFVFLQLGIYLMKENDED